MSEAPKTQQMSYNDTHHRIQHRREERGCLYAWFLLHNVLLLLLPQEM
ncbi:hypothetical protein HanPI659440_Chr02g0035301 [Helianthus annuus]|uniref:Uncharacterized protein n=1 Tax=Helianthus annuus TaxID=4232 RepID=A0A9K3NYA0_HELAN|nr:hypothetical protein HanXRQr2_Chr02g0047771 [Helianthus annuus]KAJ0617422.1 hypothetical protein HanHA89_Chr02g0041751 [Helianthus annuus]KAJ0804191.1 hypothetical protein HanPI659440_Chr02g0035301 [Helianthus annuus]KAJ0950346.1 hypothetical protein HanPSC8_Chr02g0047231 [Helianthus annuus]